MCLAVALWCREVQPVGSHGCEYVAGSVSIAVGSLGLGHIAGRGRRWGQPGLGSGSWAPLASLLGLAS